MGLPKVTGSHLHRKRRSSDPTRTQDYRLARIDLRSLLKNLYIAESVGALHFLPVSSKAGSWPAVH
jgi:hypothetical protein